MEFIETTELAGIYTDMQSQFPPEELKSLEDWQKICGRQYHVFKIIESEPVGYISIFETDKFVFIDYIAIYKNFHSKGYGGRVIDALKDFYRDKKGCFLEVEKPDQKNAYTLKRISFYERHGAQKLDIDYLYPNKSGCLPMDLYYINYNGMPSYDEITMFVKELFSVVHGDLEHAEEIYGKIFG